MDPLRQVPHYIRAYRRLREYKPTEVTLGCLWRWAKQFPQEQRGDLIRLAANLRFVSERETIGFLVELNREILRALRADGVAPEQIIYVTTDKPGSSSEVMLNLLRDRENLELRKFKFVHSRDTIGVREATRKIGVGAIIYVDDFAGTGKQFRRSHKLVAQYLVGSFSEFFLLPCMCEEALSRVTEIGVEACAGFVHCRSERPLLEECGFLTSERREALVELSRDRLGRRKVSLGFDGLATNVVFYRNAPNTTPLIFRGNRGQKPLCGIVPRFDDLGVGEQ